MISNWKKAQEKEKSYKAALEYSQSQENRLNLRIIREAQAKLEEYGEKQVKPQENEAESNLQKFMSYRFGTTAPTGVRLCSLINKH